MGTRRHIMLASAAVTAAILASAVSAAEDKTEATVAAIRVQVKAVEDGAAEYRRVDVDLDNVSAEGAVLTGYFDGHTLRKMVAWYFGESGRVTEEFYLDGDSPVFVLRTYYQYDKPIGSPPEGTLTPKVATVDQDRYYFGGGKLVRWLPPARRQSPSSAISAESAGNKLPAEARRLQPQVEAALKERLRLEESRRRTLTEWRDVAAEDKTEATVAAIRAQMKAIEDGAAEYRQIEADPEDGGECCATLTGHFSGQALRKAVARYGGPWGRLTVEYYLDGDQLVFVLVTEYHYEVPLGIHPYSPRVPRVVGTDLDRYYFSAGKMVRWLPPKSRYGPKPAYTAEEVAKEFPANARRYKTKLEAALKERLRLEESRRRTLTEWRDVAADGQWHDALVDPLTGQLAVSWIESRPAKEKPTVDDVVVVGGDYAAFLSWRVVDKKEVKFFQLFDVGRKKVLKTTDFDAFLRALAALPRGATVERLDTCTVSATDDMPAESSGRLKQTMRAGVLRWSEEPVLSCTCRGDEAGARLRRP